MKTAITAFLLCGLLIGAASASAQVKENQTNVAEDPFSWALYTYEAGADLDNEGREQGEVTLHEVDLLGTPIYMKNGPWQNVVGIGLKRTEFQFDGVTEDDIDVFDITVPLDVIYEEGDWMFWGNLTPGAFTDLEEVSEDDFRVLVYGMAMYQWKPSLQLALGGGYDRVFGDDMLYPLAGFIWRIGERWELNMVLPMPRVTYAPSSKLQLFVDARPAGGVWNIEDEESGEDIDLQLEGYRVGAGFEYELARHIWLHAAAGAAIERDYEIGEDDERVFEATAEDTYFARIGLVVR